MIVVCPQCSKRYMLDGDLLPKNGRQVRCIACQHVWHQAPDIVPMSPPPLKGIIDMATEVKTVPEKKSSWFAWIVFFTLVVSGFSFFSFGRDFVIKLWSKAERFYTLIGWRVNLPGEGLFIENATSLSHQQEGIDMIQVRGDIVNTSHQVRSIPLLKIKLMGPISHPQCKEKINGACVLERWEHQLSENSLLPGEHIHFETDSRPNVLGTQQISVEF